MNKKSFRIIGLLVISASPYSLHAHADVYPEIKIQAIEWPVSTIGAAAPIPDDRLARTDSVLLPVLIPPQFLDNDTFALVSESLHYTASVLDDGAKLSISGTRVAAAIPDKSPEATTKEILVSQGEGIVDASRVLFGAAYLVSVECGKADDARCQDDKFARATLENAVFIGGSKAPPGKALTSFAQAPLPPGEPFDPAFKFNPPGELVAGSGKGVASQIVFAPGIRFPVEDGPAYLNSQVWGIGGNHGPAGSWKDPGNYRYPWSDTFCEARSRPTPACPGGKGHQGVDIRPKDSKKATYWAVAADDGVVSNIGIYSVTVTASKGATQYRYLHMEKSSLPVKQGEKVTRGQRLGLISNDFNGDPTTVHLHFEILQNPNGTGFSHVPPYLSLVKAYQTGK